MNKALVAMALAVAFGSSGMAAEPAEKPSVAELVAAANTLATCLTPLARKADKTAAKMGKSRFNHVERQIAHDKREFLDGKPDAFSVAVMIDDLARAAGRALYFDSEIEVKIAQCIEAACPVLGDAASDDFYGLAFSCRESAAGLRQRVRLQENSGHPQSRAGGGVQLENGRVSSSTMAITSASFSGRGRMARA